MTAAGHMTIYARWKPSGTGETPGGEDQKPGEADKPGGSSTSDSGNGGNKGDLYVNGQNSVGAIRTGDTAGWGAAVLGLILSLAALGGIQYSCRHSD